MADRPVSPQGITDRIIQKYLGGNLGVFELGNLLDQLVSATCDALLERAALADSPKEVNDG